MSKFSNVLLFATGVAIGSAVTYILMKRKYEEQLDWIEEEPVEEYNEEEPAEEEIQDDVQEEKEDDQKETVQYNKYVKKYAGNSLVDEVEKEVKGSEDDVDRPYLIKPNELGEMDDYEITTLYWYEDEVLSDELGNPIEDIDETVGLENIKMFGDSSIDYIYVRNDARMTDYEVLRDIGTFWEYKK